MAAFFIEAGALFEIDESELQKLFAAACQNKLILKLAFR